MSEQEKDTWRKWLASNPEWVDHLASFFKKHPELVGDASRHQMFWHDLINALVPFVLAKGLKPGQKRPKGV